MSAPDELREARRARTRARLRRWGIVLGCALALVGLAVVAWASPLLQVTRVSVSGGGIVDADAVRASVEERTLGVPLPQVRTGRLGEQLEEENPAAQSIDVSYAWPRTLRVAIVDRTPVIAVRDGDRATRFDATGVQIDEVSAAGLEIPVLRVDEGADPSAAARDGARLIGAIGGIIPGTAEELRATRSDEFELRVRTEDDAVVQILFGDAEEGERKARIAATLLDEGHERIDVSVPAVPVAG